MEDNENIIRNFFERMAPETRLKWKAGYERHLAIEEDKYVPGNYPVTHKYKPGKQMPYPDKMPWMYKAWSNGLRILNEVLTNESLTKTSQL